MLTRAVPTSKTSSTNIANLFLDNWIVPFGSSGYVLTDNGPQFVGKFFAFVWDDLGVKHLTMTAYHPRTNAQSERFNRTIITRLRHFIAEHQRNWDIYVQPLTYAYNNQVHRCTNTSPYSLFLSRHPPGPSLLRATTDTPITGKSESSPQMIRRTIQAHILALRAKVDAHLRKSQARYKRDYD